jgi:hypothetical protein
MVNEKMETEKSISGKLENLKSAIGKRIRLHYSMNSLHYSSYAVLSDVDHFGLRIVMSGKSNSSPEFYSNKKVSDLTVDYFNDRGEQKIMFENGYLSGKTIAEKKEIIYDLKLGD